uniref:Uncharacterized protein n=2 Tax=unclassified Caudoviricetes TaxID=2788787 RepID=A0AB39ABZ5_9CAUD
MCRAEYPRAGNNWIPVGSTLKIFTSIFRAWVSNEPICS